VNILVIVLAIWTIPWKIYAIWTAVKNDHKKWFVAILLLNTVSILELYYVFKVGNSGQSQYSFFFGAKH
jgi:hypothetical protein